MDIQSFPQVSKQDTSVQAPQAAPKAKKTTDASAQKVSLEPKAQKADKEPALPDSTEGKPKKLSRLRRGAETVRPSPLSALAGLSRRVSGLDLYACGKDTVRQFISRQCTCCCSLSDI